MNTVRRVLYDPLLHFLVLGGLLFVAFRVIHGPPPAAAHDMTIEITRAKLLTFLQYQSSAFQPQYFNARFDALSAHDRQELIDNYVREEALYRQADSMGLASDDYVIRRRVVQKILYLLDDTATESFAPGDSQLLEYYRTHAQRYTTLPALTFTQVFIDPAITRAAGAAATAATLRRTLTARRAGFDDAPAYGDRFPYQQNYVERDTDFIKAQFGADFEQALRALPPSGRVWYGPIKSQFGYHLVLLVNRTPARLPPLAQVREVVRDDMLRDAIEAYRRKGVADLVSRYKVVLNDLAPLPGQAHFVAGNPQAGNRP